jgi:hypothetical protein
VGGQSLICQQIALVRQVDSGLFLELRRLAGMWFCS